MVEVQQHTITFDLLEDIFTENNTSILDNLTPAEQVEVENVVTLLDSVKENSLDDFEDVNECHQNTRHKKVTDTELDHLACKNTAQSTAYQTKWAVAVMKDKY